MPKKIKKSTSNLKVFGLKSTFQLALLVLLVMSIMLGAWAVTTRSFEMRSDASGGKKALCNSKSSTVCRNKEVGQEVTANGLAGKCVSAGKKIQKGESGKCEFKREIISAGNCNNLSNSCDRVHQPSGSVICNRPEDPEYRNDPPDYCCPRGMKIDRPGVAGNKCVTI